jgi:hypothetical protein
MAPAGVVRMTPTPALTHRSSPVRQTVTARPLSGWAGNTLFGAAPIPIAQARWRGGKAYESTSETAPEAVISTSSQRSE